MHLKIRNHLQQSIRGSDSGQAEWVAGLFWILILAILLCTELQILAMKSTAMMVEDALAASNLASALIDVGEFGKSGRILIRDEDEAFRIYMDALRDNLGLNDAMECVNQRLITRAVEVADYMICNVDENMVCTVRMDGTGRVVSRETGSVGTVRTPDGQVIEHTGIYSRLHFYVQCFPGLVVESNMGKFADIVSEKGEENENR